MIMDFDKLRTLPGMTQEEFDLTREGILALATSEKKRYTWEEKIESLVKLAKAVGRFTNTDRGTEGYKVTREHLFNAYDEFCEWRHEEPYVVDEIKALMQPGQGKP
jgi:hypothetical protein